RTRRRRAGPRRRPDPTLPAPPFRGARLLDLVDQHHGDVVANRVSIATGPANDHLLGLQVVDLSPIVRADEDRQQLGVDGHHGSFRVSPLIRLSSIAVFSSRSSGVRASTFSRSRGSVFDGRTLHHHSSYSTVSPSSRSWCPSASRFAISSRRSC